MAFGTSRRGSHAGDEVEDDVLVELVRAQVRSRVQEPEAVSVRAEEGCVRLAGRLFRHEVDGLLDAVGRMRGVRRVVAEFDVRDEAGGESGLQG